MGKLFYYWLFAIIRRGLPVLITVNWQPCSMQVAGLIPYLGDAWVAAAQVVSGVVHPVLFGGRAVLSEEALPAFGAPPALEGSWSFEALTTAGALSLTLVQQRWQTAHVWSDSSQTRRITGGRVVCAFLLLSAWRYHEVIFHKAESLRKICWLFLPFAI